MDKTGRSKTQKDRLPGAKKGLLPGKTAAVELLDAEKQNTTSFPHNERPHPGLFSIDVEAHLRKAASHTFGSAAHYPVELVRAALRRGAREVDILLRRDRIRVRDNGSGMDAAAMDTLVRLMDPAQPEAVKEEAVESLQSREGMGLLAIFASNPEESLVENVSRGNKTRLHFRGSRLKSSSCDLARGTCITLFSNRRDYTQEKYLLEVFCRSVPVNTRIGLNGRPLGGHPLLNQQMAVMKIAASPGIAGGSIGIPHTGTICHFRLLDRFIPWHHLTLPPQQGLVFDAAVETDGELTPEGIDYLCRHAQRLYLWVCRRYKSAAPDHRARFEELIFTHCRLTGDEAYLNRFSPFRIYNSRRSLDLGQVRQKAADGFLYAVPQKKKKDRLRFNTGNKVVLSLPRAQADLLINRLDIPITFLTPVTHRQNPFPGAWYKLKKRIRHLVRRVLPVPGRILGAGQLTGAEQKFLVALIRGITRTGDSTVYRYRSPVPRIVMVPGRGLFPSIPAKAGKKGDTGTYRLLVRRGHPLVRKAVRAVQVDPRNIEMFIPLLIS